MLLNFMLLCNTYVYLQSRVIMLSSQKLLGAAQGLDSKHSRWGLSDDRTRAVLQQTCMNSSVRGGTQCTSLNLEVHFVDFENTF